MKLQSTVDHLVIAAHSLDEGVAWCRETLGIEPGARGEHPLMGTHNRVFKIGNAAFPRAYLEIIAIDHGAPSPTHKRWFDLDDERVRAAIAQRPRLIHFVAKTADAPLALEALSAIGIDRGPLVAVQRPTPAGLLQWKITVRADGARLFDGVLPTLIEWNSRHPAESLPDSGVRIASLHASHPEAARVRQAFEAIGLNVDVSEGAPNLVTVLDTPNGRVQLESDGV